MQEANPPRVIRILAWTLEPGVTRVLDIPEMVMGIDDPRHGELGSDKIRWKLNHILSESAEKYIGADPISRDNRYPMLSHVVESFFRRGSVAWIKACFWARLKRHE